jgi:hypothetical protein
MGPSAGVTQEEELKDGQTIANIPLPLIFTTNFDCVIENVFERKRISCHVVFPIKTGSGLVRWVFHTDQARRGMITSWKDDIYADTAFDKTGRPTHELLGPIIVKMHGSPLSNIPYLSQHDEPSHHLVLSEADYLRSLAQKESLPPWITEQLGGVCPRYVLFMGYSISDWNIRLELYKARDQSNGIMRRSNDPDETGNWSLELRDDPIRWKLLKPFRVGIYVGDLNDIPGIIKDRIPNIGHDETARAKEILNGGEL